ncbi:MAG: ACT domain-containing protein [Candidatus Berkelbacteria bacterium]|nr:ACT domain-containing protein [Candidatus Berkelbacteria bacterium]
MMAETIELKPLEKSQRSELLLVDPNWLAGKGKTLPAWMGVGCRSAGEVMVAVCVRGFGTDPCPSIGKWASFGIITGIVGTISDCDFRVSENFRLEKDYEIDFSLFWVLQKAAEENVAKKVLDPEFVNIMLYLALPRFHYRSGDDLSGSFSQSGFCSRWQYLDINPAVSRSIGSVCGSARHEGNRFFRESSPAIRQSIELCQPKIKSQTAYICGYIKEHYSWQTHGRKILSPFFLPRFLCYIEIMKLDKNLQEIIVQSTLKNNLSDLDIIEKNKDIYSLIALNVSVPFYSVGFLAAVSGAIAEKGLNILIVSTYSKDYILIKKSKQKIAVETLLNLGFKKNK